MNTAAWRLPRGCYPQGSQGKGRGSESGGQWGFLQEVNRKKFMLNDYKKQWVRTRVLKGVGIAPSMEEGDRGAGGAGGGRGCASSTPRPAPAPGHCPSELVSGGGWARREPEVVGSGPGFAPVGRGAPVLICTEEPGIQALRARNFRAGCSFLPSLLAGRVLEPSTVVLAELGGKFRVGTPSMEDAELSRTGVSLELHWKTNGREGSWE